MLISRYLTREVVNALVAVTTVLVLVFICQQVVRYLNYAAVGKIPTNLLLELVSFEIPYLFALLLPLGLFLGMMLAYGKLYSDNEMVIMHMSGYGPTRVLTLSLWIAVAAGLVVLVLMLWVNPIISAKRQQVLTNNDATLGLIQTIVPGRFQVSPDGNHVMYIDSLSRDREIAGTVFIAHAKSNEGSQNDQPFWSLVLAKEGYQRKDQQSADQFFVTTDGYRYEGIPGQRDYKIIQFKKYAVRILQPTSHISHLAIEALSTPQLWQDYKNPKHAAELQWRISISMSVLFLAMLAVQFCSLQPRRSRFVMLLPAVIIYIVYTNLLSMSRHWMEQGVLPVSVGMWWVHGVMLLLIAVVGFVQLKK